MDQKQTGKFIAEMRRERGLTQKELADRLCISDKTVSKWECGGGFPEVSLILPLCDELGVTANELLSGKRLTDTEYKKNAEELVAARGLESVEELMELYGATEDTLRESMLFDKMMSILVDSCVIKNTAQ